MTLISISTNFFRQRCFTGCILSFSTGLGLNEIIFAETGLSIKGRQLPEYGNDGRRIQIKVYRSAGCYFGSNGRKS